MTFTKQNPAGRKPIDISGQRFGSLTVLERVAVPEGQNVNQSYWLVRCDCGAEYTRTGHMIRSKVRAYCVACLPRNEDTRPRCECCGHVLSTNRLF